VKHAGWHWREFLTRLALAKVERFLAAFDAFGVRIIESVTLVSRVGPGATTSDSQHSQGWATILWPWKQVLELRQFTQCGQVRIFASLFYGRTPAVRGCTTCVPGETAVPETLWPWRPLKNTAPPPSGTRRSGQQSVETASPCPGNFRPLSSSGSFSDAASAPASTHEWYHRILASPDRPQPVPDVAESSR